MPATIRIPAKRSKYGNRKTEYRGIMYDSAAEARHAFVLDTRKMAGEVLRWERQSRVFLIANGTMVCTLVFDFKVWDSDSHFHFEEVKGMETREYKFKIKLFRALYPNLKVEVIKA